VVAEAAYAACQRLARQHYENFPVASRLMPPASRPHIAAIYAFARMADDFADEGDAPPESRLARLDEWRERLHAAAAGRPIAGDNADASQVFMALSETMAMHRLDVTLFDDLLSAFRQDVVTTRYETWERLLDYCRRSANPIGRLVLAVTGYRDRTLDARSDAVCTALQLTNFWQDLERDWAKGRLYVPIEIVRGAGADERDLDARRMTTAWRTALHEVANRTRQLFLDGRSVADGVKGRLKWELRATWLGGVRILDRLEAIEFDVFRQRPALGVIDVAAIAGRVVVWR
jgi:hydroxysqualene synthase